MNKFSRSDLWNCENTLRLMARFVVLKVGEFLSNKFKEWLLNSVTCSKEELFSKIDVIVNNINHRVNVQVLSISTLVIVNESFDISIPENKKFSRIMHNYCSNEDLCINEMSIVCLRHYAVEILNKCGVDCVDEEKSHKFFDDALNYDNVIRIISKMRKLVIDLRRKSFNRFKNAFNFDKSINEGKRLDIKKVSSDHEIDIEIYNETLDIISNFNIFILDILGYDKKLRKVQPIESPSGDLYC
jgi:hypothetical protein